MLSVAEASNIPGLPVINARAGKMTMQELNSKFKTLNSKQTQNPLVCQNTKPGQAKHKIQGFLYFQAFGF